MKYDLIVFDWNGTLYNARAQVPDAIAPLFPGVTDVLTTLSERGLCLAIATAEGRPALQQQLKHHNIAQYFDVLRTASDGFNKPHPQMLWDVIEQIGGSAEKTLMIGDTPTDIQLAQNAEVDALAVLYGLSMKAELAKYHPVGFLQDIQQLPEWLVD
jgi:phosphoglycolate phosphatase